VQLHRGNIRAARLKRCFDCSANLIRSCANLRAVGGWEGADPTEDIGNRTALAEK
jgi:hypothetical protein